jgi:molybdenum cofactor biosynthesis enzyme
VSWQTRSYFKWIKWWRDRGIAIQMLLAIIVAIVMVWDLITSVHRPLMITNTMHDDDDDNNQPCGSNLFGGQV